MDTPAIVSTRDDVRLRASTTHVVQPNASDTSTVNIVPEPTYAPAIARVYTTESARS